MPRDVEMTSAAAPLPGTSGRPRRLPASVTLPIAIFSLLALTPVYALIAESGYILELFTRVMIFAIAACAVDLLLGYAALVTFGQAAFIGSAPTRSEFSPSTGLTKPPSPSPQRSRSPPCLRSQPGS